MERVAKILEYLRSRPEHERRIIGGAVWVAMAAIIMALWITSFRQNLNFGPPAYPESRPEQKLASPESAGVTLPDDLASPLKSLFGGFEEFQIRLEEVSRKVQDQLEKLKLPQPAGRNQPLDRPPPDKVYRDSGPKIELIAWVQEWIKSLANVFNSLFEVLKAIIWG